MATIDEDLETNLQLLADWLKTQEHLPQAIEKLVLQKFYFATERDLEAAKLLIDKNYTMRNAYPHIFIDRDPCDEATERVLENTDFLPLPGVTPDGNKLFLYQLRSPEVDKFDYTEIVKTFFMFADVRIITPDPEGLAAREVAIFDVGHYTMKHVFRTPLSVVKIYSKFTQEAHAIRIKQLHVLNCPPFLDKFLKLIRPFIKNEVFNVITFHLPGSDTLDKFIPKDMLPEEYGGKNGKIDDIKRHWVDILKSKRDYLTNGKYWKVDEGKRAKAHAESGGSAADSGRGFWRSSSID